MKKLIAMCLAMMMSISVMSVGVFAAEASNDSCAYMNIETASEAMREKIIADRNEIIYSQSWGVEGGYIVRANGTVEEVPAFYDIFPEDWEIPEVSNTATINFEDAALPTAVESWNLQVYFNEVPSSGTSPVVGNFYHDGSYIKVAVSSLTSSQHVNVGVTNNSTGRSLGYAEELYPGDYYYCPTVTLSSFYAGIRYSTYSNPGYGVLNVSHDESTLVK